MMYFMTLTKDNEAELDPNSNVDPVLWVAFVGHATGEGLRVTFPDVDITMSEALLRINENNVTMDLITAQRGGMFVWRTKPVEPVAIPTHDGTRTKQ